MSITLSIILLVISLTVLIKGSDFFIIAVEKIGLKAGVSPYILGITVVAIGTSLPELASCIAAVYSNEPEIVMGNVLGSNITNILLIVGVVAFFSNKVRIERSMTTVDLPLLITSAIFLWFAMGDGEFTMVEAALFLLALVAFVWNSYSSGKLDIPKQEVKIIWWDYLKFVLGAVGVFYGSEYVVMAIVALARNLEMGSDIVAVTVVALGTSLPELVVSITAARRGNPEMAIGNVLGSNIFNTYAVTSITSFFGTLVIEKEILTFALPFSLGVTVIFAVMALSRTLSRWEGVVLLILYGFFINQIL